MHKYAVSLSITADDLDEGELSRALNMKPNSFHKRGEQRSPESRYGRSEWRRHFEPPDGAPDWSSLDAGLKRMVELLRHKKVALLELRKRFSLVAFCGHFGSGFGGGPTVEPETLGALADLGLSIFIDTYWSSLEPDS